MHASFVKIFMVICVTCALALCFLVNQLDEESSRLDVLANVRSALKSAGAKIVAPPYPLSASYQGLIHFTFADCTHDFLVMPIPLNTSGGSLLGALRDVKIGLYQHHQAYLSDIGAPQNALVLRLRRLKASVIYMLGRSRNVPSQYSLYIIVPNECKIAGRINWLKVWQN